MRDTDERESIVVNAEDGIADKVDSVDVGHDNRRRQRHAEPATNGRAVAARENAPGSAARLSSFTRRTANVMALSGSIAALRRTASRPRFAPSPSKSCVGVRGRLVPQARPPAHAAQGRGAPDHAANSLLPAWPQESQPQRPRPFSVEPLAQPDRQCIHRSTRGAATGCRRRAADTTLLSEGALCRSWSRESPENGDFYAQSMERMQQANFSVRAILFRLFQALPPTAERRANGRMLAGGKLRFRRHSGGGAHLVPVAVRLMVPDRSGCGHAPPMRPRWQAWL